MSPVFGNPQVPFGAGSPSQPAVEELHVQDPVNPGGSYVLGVQGLGF